MLYRIKHITHYKYDQPVTLCYNHAHLMPRDTDYQRCLESHISIVPYPVSVHQRSDYFGNKVSYFSVENKHSSLEIVVDSTVRLNGERIDPGVDLDFGNTCAQAREKMRNLQDEETLLAREFVLNSPMIKISDALKDYATPSFRDNVSLLSAARDLTRRIYTDFTYDPASTTVATPLHQVLQQRRGVCQDFAHLAIGCLRAQGFPARYVSGYLETLPPPGEKKQIGSDASHAWFSVYSPGEGWFEFDPTNDNVPTEQHITTAWGRDYSDVTPLSGVIFEGGDSQVLSVSVDVQRLQD